MGQQGTFVGGTNKIYREQNPAAQSVQPVQHQPLQFSSPPSHASSTIEMSNGGVNKGSQPFPGLPAIPPEEKILLKGQTRNGVRGVVDYRQTVPGKSIPRDSVSFSTLSSSSGGGGGGSSFTSSLVVRPRTQVTLGQIGRQSSAPAETKFSAMGASAINTSNYNGSNSVVNSNNSKTRPHSLAGDRRYSVTDKDKFYSKSNSVANFRNVAAPTVVPSSSIHQPYYTNHHHHHHHHHFHHQHSHPQQPPQQPLQYPHVVGNSRPVIGGRIAVKSNSLILDKGELGGGGRSTIPNNSFVNNNNFKNSGNSSRSSSHSNISRRPIKRDFRVIGGGVKEMLIPSTAPTHGGGDPRVHHSLDRNAYRSSYRSTAHANIGRQNSGSGHASDSGVVMSSAQHKSMRRRSLATVEVEGLIKV